MAESSTVNDLLLRVSTCKCSFGVHRCVRGGNIHSLFTLSQKD